MKKKQRFTFITDWDKDKFWYKKTPTKNLSLWGHISRETGILELSKSSQLQLMKINNART
jgi:hypothetical protein